ncbi:MAG: hypothetical protein EP330_11240 [Deltaproteobacteria bacterium]|nr:MAG: hypothetical protein EP330_11240 [Deltaproteobacteria bacterium]
MRPLALLLAVLPLSTAFAHGGRGHDHGYDRVPAQCNAGVLRVAAVDGAWFDLYVDGDRQVSSRVNDGQQQLSLPAGRHFLRATDFMGEVWSEQVVDVACGETLVAEVAEDAGFALLTRFGEQPEYVAVHEEDRWEWGWTGHGWGWVERRPAREVCTPGSLAVMPQDNAWYDVYVDGQKVVESRNFAKKAVIGDLAVGSHHVRVTSFMGEVWSDGWLEVGCGAQVLAEVREDRGLRVY